MTDQTNQLTDSVIPAEIFNDLIFIEDVLNGGSHNNPELGVELNEESGLDFWSHGASAIHINTGKYFFGTYEDDIHDVMEYMEIDAKHVSGSTFLIGLSIGGLDVEDKSFNCVFNLSESKGMPQAIYDAYAYLTVYSKLSKGELLELFGVATASFSYRCIAYIIDDMDIYDGMDLYDYYFHVDKALSYDLKNNLSS